MRKIESEEDRRRGIVRYEIGRDKCVALRIDVVQRLGLLEAMRAYMVEAPTERVPVMQHGRRIGSVPGYCDPSEEGRSLNFLYDPRPGDFTRTREGWVASVTLGRGDLEAVPGFVWGRT